MSPMPARGCSFFPVSFPLYKELLRSQPACCLCIPSFHSDASFVSITSNSTSSGTLVHVWSQTAWPIILHSPPHNILPHMQSLHRLFAWSFSTILSFSVDFTSSQCKHSSLPSPIMVLSRHMALNKIPVF